MSSHCIFDTLLTEIQLQIIYFWTQVVNNRNNDWKKDTTAPDWSQQGGLFATKKENIGDILSDSMNYTIL
jgi:hypothetical protein